MKVTRLEPDILVFRGETHESIATIFLNGRNALLVDALASAADAEKLRHFIQATLGARVQIIVMTHYMSDHMSALRLFLSAQIIAHEYYSHTFYSQRQRLAEDNHNFIRPTIEFDCQLVFSWGRNRLRLMHNPGKTLDSIAIDVPDRDLVVCGDAIVGNMAYISSSVPELVDRAIERLQRLGRGRIIPGHMGPQNSETLDNARRYLARLRTLVTEIRNDGDEFDRILSITLEDCLPTHIHVTPFEREWHGRNLELIMERGLFEPNLETRSQRHVQVAHSA